MRGRHFSFHSAAYYVKSRASARALAHLYYRPHLRVRVRSVTQLHHAKWAHATRNAHNHTFTCDSECVHTAFRRRANESRRANARARSLARSNLALSYAYILTNKKKRMTSRHRDRVNVSASLAVASNLGVSVCASARACMNGSGWRATSCTRPKFHSCLAWLSRRCVRFPRPSPCNALETM